MDQLDILGRLPLFRGLNQEELAKLGRLLHQRTFPRGATVFNEGDPVTGLYFILKGRLKIVRHGLDGQESIIHLLRAGEIFGGAAFFDRGPLPASAETMEETVVGILDRRDLEALLRERPEMTMKMLEAMAERLRETQRRLAGLTRQDVPARLAELLLILARKFGKKEGSDLRLATPLTHQELADLIGSSRETVSRTLAEFKRRGIILSDGDGWILRGAGRDESWPSQT